jgi:hypothetical protein
VPIPGQEAGPPAPSPTDDGDVEVRGKLAVALGAAAAVAALGTAAWGLIAWLSGYELGFIAWIIGAGVGIAAAAFGGRGTLVALAAAALVLISIFAGKLVAVHLLVGESFSQELEGAITQGIYREYEDDARVFDTLGPDPQDAALRSFLVERGYADGPAGALPGEVIASFERWDRPRLQYFLSERPTFAQYRDWEVDRVDWDLSEAPFSPTDLVVEDLQFMDLVFAILGAVTAAGAVMRAGDADRSQRLESKRRQRGSGRRR